jgi:hypothetical protein
LGEGEFIGVLGTSVTEEPGLIYALGRALRAAWPSLTLPPGICRPSLVLESLVCYVESALGSVGGFVSSPFASCLVVAGLLFWWGFCSL